MKNFFTKMMVIAAMLFAGSALMTACTPDIGTDDYNGPPVLELGEPNVINALKVENALVVNDVTNLFFVKSAKNIPGVKAARVNTINTYEILKHDTLILTQDAVKKLEEVYA